MASIGLSRPFYALYRNQGTTVTYGGGGVLGKFTQLNVNLNDNDTNVLRADNADAESETSFSGGTAEISTDDLRPQVATVVLGTKKEAIALSGLDTEDPYWQVYDDDQNPPYLGIGGIIKKKVDKQYKYVAFILTKVQFRNPGMSVTTQGETIEWQVPTLTSTIMRSDAAKHRWYMESSLLDSEEDAEKVIRDFLNIPEDPPTGGGGSSDESEEAA